MLCQMKETTEFSYGHQMVKKRKSKVVLCDCDYYVNKSAAKSALSREILSTLRSYAFIMFYESSTL